MIYKIAADKTVSVFMEKAGYTGTDVDHTGTQTRSGRSHVLLIGPSCASLDSQGRLIWCADNDRTVMRLEKDGTTRTVLSSGRMTASASAARTTSSSPKTTRCISPTTTSACATAGSNPDKQMPNGIWRIKDGKSTMVLDATVLGGIPNGIVLSPDEKYLYANAGQRMLRYEVKADGSLGPGSLFTQGPGIGDGMKVDTLGNVYSTSGAGPGHRPHHVTDGNAPRLSQSADRRRRAEAADLRDQRRVRRSRRQEPLRHCVRPRLSHPDESGGRDAGTAHTLTVIASTASARGLDLYRGESPHVVTPDKHLERFLHSLVTRMRRHRHRHRTTLDAVTHAFGSGSIPSNSWSLKRGGVNGRPRNDVATDGAARSRQQKRTHRGRALPWHKTCTTHAES